MSLPNKTKSYNYTGRIGVKSVGTWKESELSWDMNLIDYYVETIEHSETETVDNGDGTTSEETSTTYEYILHITITSKTAEQQAQEYGFTDDQRNIMEEMLSGEFHPMMYALLGMDVDTGL